MMVTPTQRMYWVKTLCKVAEPVLSALSIKQLKQRMPVETNGGSGRTEFTHLEALTRLLAGMAPWFEHGARTDEEGGLREHYVKLSHSAIDAATDPESPDYMTFEGYQPIVDSAFLAHALLRAPSQLWEPLPQRVKRNVIAALKKTRGKKPVYNNWLLFAALIEAFLYSAGEQDWDPMRIDYAIRQHERWYLGDGAYGDGPEFHWDYYNSFVIQPMLIDLIGTVGSEYAEWGDLQAKVAQRAQRYAVVQERLISPEGTFPPIGRSLAYRCGAFQSLAQNALRDELHASLSPAQVRCALTAVIGRTLEAPGTFDEQGWLTVGLCGHQPDVGEPYISTGSLYLCTAAFLPLGLPDQHRFWQDADELWTSCRAWNGQQFPIDKALH